MIQLRVLVSLKTSVFDPQGQTIADALHSMGYGTVEDVRQGKYFELDLATTRWAQGGVAAALSGAPDELDLHLADTLRAGAGLCDQRRAGALAAGGGGGPAARL